PHCLKHAEGCPADYDEFGLDCEKCGACSIADFRSIAEKMGYKVLVAEGSPIVLKIIVSGHVDAIVGVACLNVLEKAIDKILLAGIPCMAIPLLSSDCRNTSVDEDWVHDMINVQPTANVKSTRSYVHLMRESRQMFDTETLHRLVQPQRITVETAGTDTVLSNPIAATEAISLDFLAKGGKYSRPFITLAVHDALTGGNATESTGAEHLATVSDGVRRAALAIETFHKASLVHDDIQDDDQHRYGDSTLHKKYGVPTAINVGDYMIGLGYRLVSRETRSLGPEVAGDILDCLANAHMKLSEGQGAELLWRDSGDKRLKPLDALKIYALKTSPAFEAALYSGARLAGDATEYAEPLKLFARNLGVGFQILNDLKDWQGDDDNKLSAGGDVLGGRPTLLWALALESLNEKDQAELLSLVSDDAAEKADVHRINRVRQLYHEAGVFDKAHRLVDKHQQRAEAIADEIQPDSLRRLLYYLVDTVLDRPSESSPQIIMPTLDIVAPATPS
ncbi:MAG: polyprenyl synthetase family protein, partial [Planctomycetota bacterium]